MEVSMYRFMIVVLVFVLGFSNSAFGRPPGYEEAVCNGGGESDICNFMAGSKWVCVPGTENAAATFVRAVYDDYRDESECEDTECLCDEYDYCAWGIDDTDTPFFCAVTNEDIRKVIIVGTDYDDVFRFYFDVQGVHEYNMDTHTVDVHVDGEMQGNLGNDTLDGSRVANCPANDDYQDNLYGGPGGDTIYGRDGDDNLWGGDGPDEIWGFIGADTIYGENGDNWIRGGAGGDFICGGPYVDWIAGEEGDDTLYGYSGDDFLCGDEDTDEIRADAGDDVLWADPDPVGTDIIKENGGPDYDECQDLVTSPPDPSQCDYLHVSMPRPTETDFMEGDGCPDPSVPEPDEEGED